jgi:hypothetical protein
MDEQQLVNVAVAERPTFSAKTYRPQVLLNLLLGTLTALFLGVCAVFYAELGRETIAAPYDLEAISRVPVLATVPLIAESFPSFSAGSGGSGFPPRRQPKARPSPTPPETSGGIGGLAFAAPQPPRDQPSPTPLTATEPNAMMETTHASETKRLNRSNLLTFERIAAAHAAATPNRPLSPFSPPPVAAQPDTPAPPPPTQPMIGAPVRPAAPTSVMRAAASAPESLESLDPSCRLPNRSPDDGALPTRSRLSPSQRAQLRRQTPPREREGRLAYVTYTVDPR